MVGTGPILYWVGNHRRHHRLSAKSDHPGRTVILLLEQFNLVWDVRRPGRATEKMARCELSTPTNQLRMDEIRNWLIAYCARTLGIDKGTIDADKPFDELGLESLTLVVLTEELAQLTGRDIDPVSPYDYPTINALAMFVATGVPPEPSVSEPNVRAAAAQGPVAPPPREG
jgi:acyl carrier protein